MNDVVLGALIGVGGTAFSQLIELCRRRLDRESEKEERRDQRVAATNDARRESYADFVGALGRMVTASWTLKDRERLRIKNPGSIRLIGRAAAAEDLVAIATAELDTARSKAILWSSAEVEQLLDEFYVAGIEHAETINDAEIASKRVAFIAATRRERNAADE